MPNNGVTDHNIPFQMQKRIAIQRTAHAFRSPMKFRFCFNNAEKRFISIIAGIQIPIRRFITPAGLGKSEKSNG